MVADEKDIILRDLEIGNFQTPAHALKRQDGRSVTRHDIMSAARRWVDFYQQENGRWCLVGPDLDDEELSVVAVYDDGTVIVTLY